MIGYSRQSRSTLLAAFKDDFRELLPLEDYRIFNEIELELLVRPCRYRCIRPEGKR
jgi:hypothetical protein